MLKTRLLFICSRNQWRSRTAETIYRQSTVYQVRSAGTAAAARHQVTAGDLRWADVILVMEPKHLHLLRQRFPDEIQSKRICVLDIPDEYVYLDPELVTIIQTAVDQELGPAVPT